MNYGKAYLILPPELWGGSYSCQKLTCKTKVQKPLKNWPQNNFLVLFSVISFDEHYGPDDASLFLLQHILHLHLFSCYDLNLKQRLQTDGPQIFGGPQVYFLIELILGSILGINTRMANGSLKNKIWQCRAPVLVGQQTIWGALLAIPFSQGT